MIMSSRTWLTNSSCDIDGLGHSGGDIVCAGESLCDCWSRNS